MKAIVVAAASALALAPAVTSAASAGQATGGSWSFTDYTADPSSLAADDAFHTVTGATITSYCHGSRVPSAPQDVTSHALTVSRTTVLRLSVDDDMITLFPALNISRKTAHEGLDILERAL